MKKTRIIIKISGEAIKGSNKSNNIYDNKKLLMLCKQLKHLNKFYSIGLVLGGGNIWRGNMNKSKIFTNCGADYMGMMATIINALAFKELLLKIKVKCEICSAIYVSKLTNKIDRSFIDKCIKQNKIIIFAGGIGQPFFTTDTACAKRAIDMNSKIILMGKNNVDGVYNSDPNKNKNAKFIKNLLFSDAINKKLNVMDLSALKICKKHNINIYVFDILANNGIINVAKKKNKFTWIHN